MRRVAVVGGGIFGCTAAIHLARDGHDVHLFEQQPGLLQAASGINQYRLHRGYHYPRSAETVGEIGASIISFRAEYGKAVIDGGSHLYAIALKGSKTSGAEYLAFCDEHGLEYKIVPPSALINPGAVEFAIEVEEARFDPDILRSLAKEKLRSTGVHVHLGVRAEASVLGAFDTVVVAAYAQNNAILAAVGRPRDLYQFEICEKPVVALPDWFGSTSIVVMDGDFMSVDPLGNSPHFVLGHVVHAIHGTNVGFEPEIPREFAPYLNRGIVGQPAHTRISQVVDAGSYFIPALADARHIGSMYTIRMVLSGRESDDARPSIVNAIDGRFVTIFSGKISTCVECAQRCVEFVRAQ